MINVVVICHLGRLGSNIQRALTSLNTKTYLITDDRALSVSYSRGCTVLHHTRDLATADEATIIKLINDTHTAVGITSVIPADVTASLLLNRIRDRLTPPIFPLASVDTLQRLDNKWEFAKICLANDVDIPPTLYFTKNATVDLDAVQPYPVIIKPAQGIGQRNIVIIHRANEMAEFRTQHSHDDGMVIQRFIHGQEWAIGVLAIDGVVRNWTAWECPSQLVTRGSVSRFMVTKFCDHARLLEMAQTVIRATGFSGIANFDAILGEDGRMRLLECNPRFFNRMLAARIGGGLNFVAAAMGYPQRLVLNEGMYYPWQYAFTRQGMRLLASGGWPLRWLLRDLYELMRDPLPAVMRKLTKEEA